MPDNYSRVRDNNPMAFGVRLTTWPVGEGYLPRDVKAVCFNTAGTCDITNDDGSTEDGVPFAAMQPLPIVPAKIRAMSSATKCYLVL